MIRKTLIFIGGLACHGQALAFDMAFPLDCTLGQGCYIQQFYDHDAGKNWQDFTCGPLAYDGHDGTDFALPTRAAMAAGVNILAAASGTVIAARDEVADFVPFEAGKECGNGVVIDHAGGWETQYCHMKQGSVTVKVGQSVTAGMSLGQVGQSGMAEFPHMHLSVRQNGIEVDPFSPENPTTCGALPSDDLWLNTPKYQAGGILGAGFATEIPAFEAVKSGLTNPDGLPDTAPALAMWVYLFGGQRGDALLFEIQGPEGQIVTDRMVVERNRALFFQAKGRKMRGASWPVGIYTGKAQLIRGGALIDDTTITVTIAP